MARTKKEVTPVAVNDDAKQTGSLTALLSKKTVQKTFHVWIVGDTPLICHAWSEKAKREMLTKQVKATKAGKDARDPEADFISSLYPMEQGTYDKGNYKADGKFGFPATGIKNCLLSAAHKDKGIARSNVMSALWVDAEMVRVAPALRDAVCDIPLVRIWGSEPEMREDMVKIGSGLNKTANLAYRAQFRIWAMKISGRINPAVLRDETLGTLFQESGFAAGIGEWRIERKGVFGAFHMADADEEREWDAFAAGKGPRPTPVAYQMAAAA